MDSSSILGNDQADTVVASEDDYEDEEYRNFIYRLLCDELEEDEAAEEEYKPPEARDDGDEEDEDDDDDEDDEDGEEDDDEYDGDDEDEDDDDGSEGLAKVAKNEVQELVNGCWKTLLGEVPDETQIPPVMPRPKPAHQNSSSSMYNLNYNGMMNYPAPAEEGVDSDQLSVTTCDSNEYNAAYKKSSHGSGQHRQKHLDQFQSHSAFAPNNDDHSYSADLNAKDPQGTSKFANKHSKEAHFISKIVTQMFSSETKPSDVCVDGYPLNAYRRIIARQLSLASQLLVQMFLLSGSKDSAAFIKCREFYDTLCQHKATSLKRAALIQMNLENLQTFKGSKDRGSNTGGNSGIYGSSNQSVVTGSQSVSGSGGTIQLTAEQKRKATEFLYRALTRDNNPSAWLVSLHYHPKTPAPPVREEETQRTEKKLTRLVASNKLKSRSRNRLWQSMLDLPLLSNPTQFSDTVVHLLESRNPKSSEAESTSGGKTDAGEQGTTVVTLTSDDRTYSITEQEKRLQFMNDGTERVCSHMRTPYWRCLRATLQQPLTKAFVEQYFSSIADSGNTAGSSFDFNAQLASASALLSGPFGGAMPLTDTLGYLGAGYTLPFGDNLVRSPYQAVYGTGPEAYPLLSSSGLIDMPVANACAIGNYYQLPTAVPLPDPTFASQMPQMGGMMPMQMQSFQMEPGMPATVENMNMIAPINSVPSNSTGDSLTYQGNATDPPTQVQQQAIDSRGSSPSEMLELPVIDAGLESKGFLEYLRDQQVFTPAENDLLLRGIVTLKEYNWAKIAELYLPNKSAQTLMAHFHEMCALTTRSKNVFKEYLKLEPDAKSRDSRWTHFEDVDLLRGFFALGDKWHLISLYFLPHRKKKELKLRWSLILKQGFKREEQLMAPGGVCDSMNSSGGLVVPQGVDAHKSKKKSNNGSVGNSNKDPSVPYDPSSLPAGDLNCNVKDFNGLSNRAKIFLHYISGSSKSSHDAPAAEVNLYAASGSFNPVSAYPTSTGSASSSSMQVPMSHTQLLPSAGYSSGGTQYSNGAAAYPNYQNPSLFPGHMSTQNYMAPYGGHVGSTVGSASETTRFPDSRGAMSTPEEDVLQDSDDEDNNDNVNTRGNTNDNTQVNVLSHSGGNANGGSIGYTNQTSQPGSVTVAASMSASSPVYSDQNNNYYSQYPAQGQFSMLSQSYGQVSADGNQQFYQSYGNVGGYLPTYSPLQGYAAAPSSCPPQASLPVQPTQGSSRAQSAQGTQNASAPKKKKQKKAAESLKGVAAQTNNSYASVASGINYTSGSAISTSVYQQITTPSQQQHFAGYSSSTQSNMSAPAHSYDSGFLSSPVSKSPGSSSFLLFSPLAGLGPASAAHSTTGGAGVDRNENDNGNMRGGGPHELQF